MSAESKETRQGETRSAEAEVEIAASAETVWRALTDAAELERWFALEARVEAGEGGSIWLSWKNEFAGESRILTWDPPRLLRTSWGGLDGQEPAQVTEYRLEARGGSTFLRVVTSGFPADAAWDGWVEGTVLGWRYELTSLKHYLERHAGQDREVVYLRRRVDLAPQAAWSRLFGAGGLPRDPLGAEAFDDSVPRQYAAVIKDPADALLRISLEPTQPGTVTRDVTLWLSAWNADRPRLDELAADWRQMLERLFPEGESV